MQEPNTTTTLNGIATGHTSNAVATVLDQNVFSLSDANVLTTAWTLSLRGNCDTSGTMYWRWWVYKRAHLV